MARRLMRALRVLVLSAVAICLLTVALIKSSMVMARIHVQHLLTDFQSIQPMQSNWADAQRLMRRWGRWGNYRGTCTATDCTYTIAVEDWLSRLAERVPTEVDMWLFEPQLLRLQLAGWRGTDTP